MAPNRTPLLVPGMTCGSLHEHPESGLLVDGRDIYKAVYDACSQARHTILIAGWQFDNNVALLRGDDAEHAEHATRLVAMLRELCVQRPELEVFILGWKRNPLFVLERVPLQPLLLRLAGHPRIHYRSDASHPAGASQHQKFLVVDRAIALVGGMDICNSRWDRREHRADDRDRRNRWRHYGPYHDVHAYVTGDAVDVLRSWFCERWERATGQPLALPDVPRGKVEIEPSLALHAPRVGLARTCPASDEPACRGVEEIYQLHLRAIAAAEQLIYLENQYLSSHQLARALEQRMARGGRPLQIVLLLPAHSKRFKERISMGAMQEGILKQLGDAAARFGHRLGVYYSAVRDGEHEVPVFVHAKVLAVDDRFLLVSSANTTNRSMGFDSELGIAWESPVPSASLREARVDLLAEHCGIARSEAQTLLCPIDGLVDRLDALAGRRAHRLRLHARNVDEHPGPVLSKLLREPTPFDPRDPRSFLEALPAPVAFVQRLWQRLRGRRR